MFDDPYLWLKWSHILSSTLLFGTGLGTAFHMWFAHLRGDARVMAVVAENVVLADWLITTPMAVFQPASGIGLIWLGGYDPWAPWLLTTYGLYILAGACWLPVVGLQIRIRKLAQAADQTGTPLPVAYHRAMRRWFWLGWPAFGAFIAIFALMVIKPYYS